MRKNLAQKNITKNAIQKERGYTLLFAVLVAAIVLSIGISILTISQKEYLLSSGARDSNVSLYAADSGIECAEYADQTYQVFSTSTPAFSYLNCGQTNPIVTASNPSGTYGPYFYTFSVQFGQVGASCTTVTVTKQYTGTPSALSTTIDSRGYNLGYDDSNDSCDLTSPKKVERGLRLSY